MYWDVKPNNR
jgi:hypothetical protein